MASPPAVPGIYFEPRAREAAPPRVRTDVAGFIGFETRVREAAEGSLLTGGPPPIGHVFRVDVERFAMRVDGRRVTVRGRPSLVLSEDPGALPMASGESVAYALAGMVDGDALEPQVVAGMPQPIGRERAPADEVVAAAILSGPADPRTWLRLADVHVAREGGGVRLTVVPRLPPARCDDWSDVLEAFGAPPPESWLLAAARAYFANGGGRLYLATVRRPPWDDAAGLVRARGDMVGLAGAGVREATGLESLLLVDEVSVVDAPDLYARRVEVETRVLDLPATEEAARFGPCEHIAAGVGGEVRGRRRAREPIFDDAAVKETQQRLLERCMDRRWRWRVLLLLDVPLELDSRDGRYHGPTVEKALAWRDWLAGIGGSPGEYSCAALYFPWVLGQERVDAEVVEMPPTPYAAGVIARRDLARGPHVAPANETLRAVAGLTRPLDDRQHGDLYGHPAAVNVLRAFPGHGVQVWGARTLSSDRWLRYLPVRRCLSAIQRRMHGALRELVFEPHTPFLWLQITQQALGVLLPLFESGALRGASPQEAFSVRCDESVNPPEQIEAGELVVEVRVAIAAPGEFITFRVGRREGVVEVVE